MQARKELETRPEIDPKQIVIHFKGQTTAGNNSTLLPVKYSEPVLSHFQTPHSTCSCILCEYCDMCC